MDSEVEFLKPKDTKSIKRSKEVDFDNKSSKFMKKLEMNF